jgi:hypothetical protein
MSSTGWNACCRGAGSWFRLSRYGGESSREMYKGGGTYTSESRKTSPEKDAHHVYEQAAAVGAITRRPARFTNPIVSLSLTD